VRLAPGEMHGMDYLERDHTSGDDRCCVGPRPQDLAQPVECVAYPSEQPTDRLKRFRHSSVSEMASGA
jgi:hypothetical protein